MPENKKPELAVYDGHMISRLKAFTDCVMSVIATIMVLNIPMPKGNGQHLSDYAVMATPILIFIVSFLVVVSFYFGIIRTLNRIHEITGWQIFAYICFLMLVSLFPILTQVVSRDGTVWFLILYIFYLMLTSRLHDRWMNRLLVYNGEELWEEVKSGKVSRLMTWSLWASVLLAIGFSFLNWGSLSAILMLYIPVRSLIKALVYKR
ncbi:MAG: TMEM175 family protein [Streptococcaceae bacterium]|nr:TMEM175 family protein [Streptococcaceae bacterium]